MIIWGIFHTLRNLHFLAHFSIRHSFSSATLCDLSIVTSFLFRALFVHSCFLTSRSSSCLLLSPSCNSAINSLIASCSHLLNSIVFQLSYSFMLRSIFPAQVSYDICYAQIALVLTISSGVLCSPGPYTSAILTA